MPRAIGPAGASHCSVKSEVLRLRIGGDAPLTLDVVARRSGDAAQCIIRAEALFNRVTECELLTN